MLRKLIPLFGLVFMLAVAACGSKAPTATWTPIASPEVTSVVAPTRTVGALPSLTSVDPALRASVRMLLAVPDRPPIDVYLESNQIGSRLAYGNLTSPIAVPPGKFLIRVVPATVSPDAPDKVLLSQTVELGESEGAIFALGGTKDQMTLKHVTEDKSPIKGGQARVLIVSVVQGDAKVDVSADEQALVSLTAQDQQPNPQLMKAGRYNFKAAGGSLQAFNLPVSVLENQVYTVVVFGPAAGPLKLVVANSPTLRQTSVRVLNLSPDVGTVDIYLNGKLLASRLEYHKISGWQTLTITGVASYTLRVVAAGADPKATGVSLLDTSLTLKPDDANDIVILDPKATLKGRVYTEDLSRTEPDKARLTYLNLVLNENSVVPFISASQIPGTQPVQYGGLSNSIPIQAGARQLAFGVTVPGTQARMVEVPPDVLTLKAGTEYFYVVTGQATQSGPLYFATDVGINDTAGTSASSGDTMPVRVINAISDLKAIDIYVNGAIVFKNVESGKGSSTTLIASTAQSITLTATGDSTVLARISLRFQKDEPDSLIAVGTAKTANILQTPDLISAGSVPVRVINSAPGQPQVSVQAIPAAASSTGGRTPTASPQNTVVIAKTLVFAAASGFTPLPSGTYSFIVVGRDAKTVLGRVDKLVLQTGIRYDLILLPGSDKTKVSISVVVTG